MDLGQECPLLVVERFYLTEELKVEKDSLHKFK